MTQKIMDSKVFLLQSVVSNKSLFRIFKNFISITDVTFFSSKQHNLSRPTENNISISENYKCVFVAEYRKTPKYLDTPKIAVLNYPKILTMWLYRRVP